MLHLVFYAKIASETQEFDISDVLNGICEKLIFRHPHVYGDEKIVTEDEVKANWEKLKLKEGNTSVLGGVPKSLPSLVKAIRIQEKVKAVGFDWKDSSQALNKVKEEISEFEIEEKSNDVDKMSEEFGDILFSIINYARYKGVNPEEALEKTNKKFIKRFQYIEKKALKAKKSIDELSVDEMNGFWDKSKMLK
jgi:XTP/dITP diphosphohydrolase